METKKLKYREHSESVTDEIERFTFTITGDSLHLEKMHIQAHVVSFSTTFLESLINQIITLKEKGSSLKKLSKILRELLNSNQDDLSPETKHLLSALADKDSGSPRAIGFIDEMMFPDESTLREQKGLMKYAITLLSGKCQLVVADTLPSLEDGYATYHIKNAEAIRGVFYQWGFQPISLDNPYMGGIPVKSILTGDLPDYDQHLTRLEVSTLLLNKLQRLAQSYFTPGSVKDKQNTLVIGRMNAYAKITNPPAYAILKGDEGMAHYDELISNRERFLLPVFFEDDQD